MSQQNPKMSPETMEAIESDDPGCGKPFDLGLCSLRHRAAKVREARGQRHQYDPCCYCLKFVTKLADKQPETEPETPAILETPKENQMTNVRPVKIEALKACKHCKITVKKYHGRGLCQRCYFNPEIKNQYPAQRKVGETSWQAAANSAPVSVSAPVPIDMPGIGTCPAADTIHARTPAPRVDAKPAGLSWFMSEKKAELAVLKQQYTDQDRLLGMKGLEINILERFLQDLEYVTEA